MHTSLFQMRTTSLPPDKVQVPGDGPSHSQTNVWLAKADKPGCRVSNIDLRRLQASYSIDLFKKTI